MHKLLGLLEYGYTRGCTPNPQLTTGLKPLVQDPCQDLSRVFLGRKALLDLQSVLHTGREGCDMNAAASLGVWHAQGVI